MMIGRNIVRTISLLVAILLLGGVRCAFAQNTSAEPYIGSWHLYRVAMGDIANASSPGSVTWELYDNLSEAADYTLTDGLANSGETWVHTHIVDAATDSASVEIKFLDALFNAGQTWYLVYSETCAQTGECVAKRSFTITLRENSFYLTLAENNTDCNPLNGEVLNWDSINGIAYEAATPFTVILNKTSGFDLRSWSFSGTIVCTNSYYYSGANGETQSGTTTEGYPYSIAFYDATNSTHFTATITVNDADDYSTDTIYFTVPISGVVYVGTAITLTVSDGLARSGTNYEVVTEDNLTLPSEPPDRSQTITLLPLPAISNIAIAQ